MCLIHRYDKWSEPFEVPNMYTISTSTWQAQSRTCSVCGIVERREIGSTPTLRNYAAQNPGNPIDVMGALHWANEEYKRSLKNSGESSE